MMENGKPIWYDPKEVEPQKLTEYTIFNGAGYGKATYYGSYWQYSNSDPSTDGTRVPRVDEYTEASIFDQIMDIFTELDNRSAKANTIDLGK